MSSSEVYYRVDPSVPWESLPTYRWEYAKNLPSHVKESDRLNHRILLETIFQALSCGRGRFKTSHVESCEYAFDVLADFVLKPKHDDAQLGAVALHVATMVQYRFIKEHPSETHGIRDDDILINKKKMIMLLFELLRRLYPEAAQVCLSSNGRLPLHWALEAGKTWGDEEENHYHDTSIQVLVKSYPNGVTVIDPVTGLAPFMMAAAANDQYSSVNTTFRLLRMMDPTMLLAGALAANDLHKREDKQEEACQKEGPRDCRSSSMPASDAK